MTFDEYKKHLESLGPLNEVYKALLSAYDLGYGQGLNDRQYPYSVLFAVEQAIKNGACGWEIEEAFEDFEEECKRTTK